MILVTGATGFLGSEVVRQLVEQNRAVRAIKRQDSETPLIIKNTPVEWVEADILNYFDLEDALEGVDQVYHCAAIISFNSAENKKMIAVNTEGTANIVNLCIEKKIKLLHTSSVAALGEPKGGGLISEKDIWEYTSKENGYAISKYLSEMEVWRGIAEGLNAVIVNPSIIIGKNSSTGTIQFFNLIKKGFPFYPTGTCGIVDVEDVARSMIMLMESSISGKRFIINSENWSYKAFFEEIATQYQVKPPTLQVKPWLLKLAVPVVNLISAITGKESPLTAETARSASQIRQYNNNEIKKAISINFKPINQAIAEACKTSESE